MSAQKIILAELQSQFGGSGAAFAKTFTGQMELLNHELGAIGEEATMAVMPALQEMVQGFREIIPIIGPQLKAAIESVDWQAFAKSVIDLTTFLITHAETIAKVVAGLFILNTAFNLGRIAVALYNAGAVILNATFVRTAAGIQLATGALKLFRTALITTGVGALVVGLGFIIEAIINTNDAASDGAPIMDQYGNAIRKSGDDAKYAAEQYANAATTNRQYANQLRNLPPALPPMPGSTVDNLRSQFPNIFPEGGAPIIPEIPGVGGSVAKDPTGLKAWTATNAKQAKISAKEVKLISKGLSADVAASLVGSGKIGRAHV
jgi:hypothetical protein